MRQARAAACPSARLLRRAGASTLQCSAAADTDFSSIEAWEAEYAAIAKAQSGASSAAKKGGNLLTKALPGLGVIGQAFERASQRDGYQEKMMSENEEAKQGEKQVPLLIHLSSRGLHTYVYTHTYVRVHIYKSCLYE